MSASLGPNILRINESGRRGTRDRLATNFHELDEFFVRSSNQAHPDAIEFEKTRLVTGDGIEPPTRGFSGQIAILHR